LVPLSSYMWLCLLDPHDGNLNRHGFAGPTGLACAVCTCHPLLLGAPWLCSNSSEYGFAGSAEDRK
jgi:hypothetical protein